MLLNTMHLYNYNAYTYPFNQEMFIEHLPDA